MPGPPAGLVWLPAGTSPQHEGMVALGGDLRPATLVAAYRNGLFPMPVKGIAPMAWWSPDPRAVLPPERFHRSRSLRRSIRRYTTTVDQGFGAVVDGCADPDRPHGWISPDMAAAYRRLHAAGPAHSVEVWAEGEIVGGLYGVAIGSFFAGESMFHRARDASKVALARLVDLLRPFPHAVVDIQWATPHLVSLGAVEIPRRDYLRRLAAAVGSAGPFDPPGSEPGGVWPEGAGAGDG